MTLFDTMGFRNRGARAIAFALATVGTLTLASCSGDLDKQNVDWSLAWSDEFEGPSIDTTNWRFETGNNNGWGNNELEYYRAENATIENGNLVITAKEESYGGYAYTSARMKTQGLKSFKYGKVEARIKLPYGQGIWPAFWMLGDSISTVGWPKCGEIDILEMVGGTTNAELNRGDRIAHGTGHWANASGNHQYIGSHTATPDSRLADDYHVFAVEWDDSAITWFMDGEDYYRLDTTDAEMTELHANHFILLNLAVGGQWPGSPDSSTVFPQTMYVDYVRYWVAGE